MHYSEHCSTLSLPQVGSHMLYEDDPDQMSFAVKHMKLHEHYNSNTVENDICMLKLDGEATSGPNVAWIGFPASMEEYEAGTDCIVTGWGTTTEGGSLGRTLQKVRVKSFSFLSPSHSHRL